MGLARRLASLGRAARSEAGVKVRQPLSRALVFLPPNAPPLLDDMVAEELNVDEIDVAEELGEVLEFELVPNFGTLGPRLRDQVKYLKPALAALDGAGAAAALEAGRSLTVDLPGGPVVLGADDVQLRVRGQQGFAVSREGGEVVALDLVLDDSLRQRGLAREVVRLVQDLRKNSGLDVSDRIVLHLVGLDSVAGHFDFIAREVLAVAIVAGPGEGEGTLLDLETDGGVIAARAWIRKAGEPGGSSAGGRDELGERGAQGGALGVVQGGDEMAIDPLHVRHDGAPQCGLTGVGQHDMDAAPIGRAVLAGDQSGLRHAVHQPGDATGGEGHVGAQPTHGQAALGRTTDVDQDVEPDQRYAHGLYELLLEEEGEAPVGADDEAHQLQPLVVDLRQHPTGARGIHVVAPHRAPIAPSYSAPTRVAVPIYLFDKYLYNQILSGKRNRGHEFEAI